MGILEFLITTTSMADHAILDLGEDELQFTTNNYKVSVRGMFCVKLRFVFFLSLETPDSKTLVETSPSSRPPVRRGTPGRGQALSVSLLKYFWSTSSQLITDDDDASSWRTSNFLKFEFYQQFFDVDTAAVKNRVLYSMVPLPGKSFLQHHIRPKPDLYGPFWVCVTLVFSIAISGNMASYLQKSFEADEDHPIKWHYDFHKV